MVDEILLVARVVLEQGPGGSTAGLLRVRKRKFASHHWVRPGYESRRKSDHQTIYRCKSHRLGRTQLDPTGPRFLTINVLRQS